MKKSFINIVGAVAAVGLCLALLVDFGHLMFGGLFTADSYYLPLAEFVPKEQVRQMEDLVMDIHTQSMHRQGILLGVIHVTALAAVL